MNVSVILCTYNGSWCLERTLASLRDQTLEKACFEVILVDNASTDGTGDLAAGLFKDFGLNGRVLIESTPGKANALRTGVLAAEADHFCILDDDNILAEDYLEVGLAFLRAHPDVGLIGGRAFPDFPPGADVPEDFHERYARQLACYDHGEELIWGSVPPGAGSMGPTRLLRHFVEKVGNLRATRVQGQDGKAIGANEDLEYSYVFVRWGWKVAHVPELSYLHVMTPRRITPEYIEQIQCEAMRVGPWLITLRDGAERVETLAATNRSVLALLQGIKYTVLAALPSFGNAKLAKSSFWKKFYLASYNGHAGLLRNRSTLDGFLSRVKEHPLEPTATRSPAPEEVVTS